MGVYYSAEWFYGFKLPEDFLGEDDIDDIVFPDGVGYTWIGDGYTGKGDYYAVLSESFMRVGPGEVATWSDKVDQSVEDEDAWYLPIDDFADRLGVHPDYILGFKIS